MIIKIGDKYFGTRYIVVAEPRDRDAPPPRAMRVILEDGLAIYLDPAESEELCRRLDGISGEPPAAEDPGAAGGADPPRRAGGPTSLPGPLPSSKVPRHQDQPDVGINNIHLI